MPTTATTATTTSPAAFTLAPLMDDDCLPQAKRGRKAEPLPADVAAVIALLRAGQVPASGCKVTDLPDEKAFANLASKIYDEIRRPDGSLMATINRVNLRSGGVRMGFTPR